MALSERDLLLRVYNNLLKVLQIASFLLMKITWRPYTAHCCSVTHHIKLLGGGGGGYFGGNVVGEMWIVLGARKKSNSHFDLLTLCIELTRQLVRLGRKEMVTRPSVNYAKDWLDHSFLFLSWPCLVWKKSFTLYVITRGQSTTTFLYIGPFSAWWQPNNQPGDPSASLLLTSVRRQSFAIDSDGDFFQESPKIKYFYVYLSPLTNDE